MLSALRTLKGLIKTKSYHIDDPLFRLHYHATAGLLLAFCLILTAKVMFGDTIDCKSRMLGREDFYDNICYTLGTFTGYGVEEQDFRAAAGIGPEPSVEEPNLSTTETSSIKLKVSNTIAIDTNTFPFNILNDTDTGVFLKQQFRSIHKLMSNSKVNRSPNVTYLFSGVPIPRDDVKQYRIVFWHRYYQYVPIILFLQAVFFYLPHYMWKNWETGIVGSICKLLYENRFTPNDYVDTNQHMIDYLRNCIATNRLLVFKYYFCHIMLLINLVVQVAALNAIFNNQFVTYGMDVFQYLFIDDDVYGLRDIHGNSTNELNNPMDFVFPKVTLCEFKILSEAGGNLDRASFMCALPLNIIHDKFFLVLWFWFLILTLITIAQFIFYTLCIIMPVFRRHIFERRFGYYPTDYNRQTSNLSEWFMLYLIGCNSDHFAFSALLRKLDKVDGRTSSLSENHSLV